MAESRKNKELLGALFLLFLLSSRQGSGFPGNLFASGTGGLQELLGRLSLDSVSRDLHRITDLMDQLSGLSQMAGMLELAGPLMAMLGTENENSR